MMFDGDSRSRQGLLLPSFEVKLALLVLFLSVLYALTFTNMVYVSLLEQVFHPPLILPRFAGAPHHHNAIEWVLLASPALLGWAGTIASGRYLARRWVRHVGDRSRLS